MHTKKQASANVVSEPDYQSSQWVYDALMAEIEPDLTSENIVKLDEMYAGETEEQKKVRYERYELAFIVLGECLDELKYDLALEEIMVGGVMEAIDAQEKREGKEIPQEEIDAYVQSLRFAA